ncbi:hypothetical protein BWK67_07960 [Campylobacter fetus]|uniref:ComF family protein n=1 Tax=Campylobacter fetus TaxID=196 RepID=UPI0010024A1E|nr:ComF family protein [Campylobacter fetus]QQF52652.1 ComF family protein [Campylobacter fetus subsp. venerealis]RUT49477.1 hypothetical protein BWK67_07960 [Campylobacter fetus]RUT49736.1 hypothetical protein BWK51_07940 [Campylobacter fetus]
MYQLKYNNSLINAEKIQLSEQIARIAANEIKSTFYAPTLKKINAIIPIPSSKNREIQPVYLIADRIAQILDKKIDFDYIHKIKNTSELKSVTDYNERVAQLNGAFSCDRRYAGGTILLIDDLYRSGASINEVARTMQQLGGVDSVFAVAMTKTRVNR